MKKRLPKKFVREELDAELPKKKKEEELPVEEGEELPPVDAKAPAEKFEEEEELPIEKDEELPVEEGDEELPAEEEKPVEEGDEELPPVEGELPEEEDKEDEYVADVNNDSDIFFDDEEDKPVKEEEEKPEEEEEEPKKLEKPVEEEKEEDDEEEKKEKEEEEDPEKEEKGKLDVEEEVNAIFAGESFSKATQKRIRTIFEAAVRDRVVKFARKLKSKYNRKLTEARKGITNKTVDQLDGYMNYVVENWMSDNKVAIESSLRLQITEDFINGLQKVFKENYIEVPEGKENLVESLSKKVAQLEKSLNSSENKNVALTKKLNESLRSEVLRESCKGLAETEAEKVKGLCEGIEYDESFGEKVKMVRESYFPKKTVVSKEETPKPIEDSNIPNDIKAVKDFLDRTLKG